MHKLLASLLFFTSFTCLKGQNNVEILLQQAHIDRQDYGNMAQVWAISHDDQWILSKSNAENTLVIWNLKASRIYKQWPFDTRINSAVFKDDNENVLINDEVVFNIHTGKIIILPEIDEQQLKVSLAWSRPKHELTYDVRNERPRKSFLGSLIASYASASYHDGIFHCFNQDSTIFWGSKLGRVFAYDIRSKSLTYAIDVKVGRITGLTCLRGSSMLAISGDKAICLYNIRLKTKKDLPINDMVEFSCNESAGYSAITTLGDYGAALEFWNSAATPNLLFKLQFGKRTGAITTYFIDDKDVLVIADSLPLMVIDLVKRQKIWQDTKQHKSVRFSEHGTYLMCDYGFAQNKLFKLPAMEDISDRLKKNYEIAEIFSIQMSPDEEWLLLSENHNPGDRKSFELFAAGSFKLQALSGDTIINIFKAAGVYYLSSIYSIFTPVGNEIIFYAEGSNKIIKYNI
jgi:hypothetical protein